MVNKRLTWVDYYISARGTTSVKFATERGRALKYRILEGVEVKSSGEISDSNYTVEFPENDNEKILRIFDARGIGIGNSYQSSDNIVRNKDNSEIINSVDFSKSRIISIGVDRLILPDFIPKNDVMLKSIGFRDYSNWRTLRKLHVRYVDELLAYALENKNITYINIEGANYTEVGEELIKKIRERGVGFNLYGSGKIEKPEGYENQKSFWRKNNIGKDFGKIIHSVGEKIYG